MTLSPTIHDFYCILSNTRSTDYILDCHCLSPNPHLLRHVFYSPLPLPSLCSSHAGLLLFWTLQVHTQLWACTVLFPLRTPFLFSSLFIADSSSLMSQHKYFSPRKNDTATLSKIPAHLIHLKYQTILCDFLHCIWGYLVFSCLFLFNSSPKVKCMTSGSCCLAPWCGPSSS